MPKLWRNMSTDEKLDFLRERVAELNDRMDRNSGSLEASINRALQTIEAKIQKVAKDLSDLEKRLD